MLLAKVTDELLMAVDLPSMKGFFYKLTQNYKVIKSIINLHNNFKGCKIDQDE